MKKNFKTDFNLMSKIGLSKDDLSDFFTRDNVHEICLNVTDLDKKMLKDIAYADEKLDLDLIPIRGAHKSLQSTLYMFD